MTSLWKQTVGMAISLGLFCIANSVANSQCAYPDLTQVITNRDANSLDVEQGRIVLGEKFVNSSVGQVSIYEPNGSTWNSVATLHANDGEPSDFFGVSVSCDGDRIAVGAPYEDEAGESHGAVYVFERLNGSWTQTAKLIPTVGFSLVQFGSKVELSGDTLVVGTAIELAVIYEWDGNSWTQVHEISTNGEIFDLDGDVLALGDPESFTSRGTVDLWRRSLGQWSFEQTLNGEADSMLGDRFGSTMSLNGNQLAVGVPGRDDDTGVVRLYEFDGAVWQFVQELHRFRANGGDLFGEFVEWAGDRVYVGALGEDPVKQTISVFARETGDFEITAEIPNPSHSNGIPFFADFAVVNDSIVITSPDPNTNQDSFWVIESNSLGLGLLPARVAVGDTVTVAACNALPGTPRSLCVDRGGRAGVLCSHGDGIHRRQRRIPSVVRDSPFVVDRD